MERLAGKVALVSGGARGLGAAHARAIVAEGGKVVIGNLLDDEGQALAAELLMRPATCTWTSHRRMTGPQLFRRQCSRSGA